MRQFRPQSAITTQSAVCILYLVYILNPICSLHLTLTVVLSVMSTAMIRCRILDIYFFQRGPGVPTSSFKLKDGKNGWFLAIHSFFFKRILFYQPRLNIPIFLAHVATAERNKEWGAKNKIGHSIFSAPIFLFIRCSFIFNMLAVSL